MRRAHLVFVACLLAIASSTCAGPKFYRLDGTKEHETGIPIYPLRLFLVVAYTGAKDHPVEVTLVRVPNLAADPIYARQVRGWGNGEFSVEFEGGVLKGVGGKSDSQSADTISALGSVIGNASKLLAQPLPDGEPPAFRLYELVMEKAGTRLVPVMVGP